MSDLVERLRKELDSLDGTNLCKGAADRIEELEAIREKLIQERFKLSAEATAHLEAFGIPWEDDGYTIVGLLISKCEKLMKERDHWKANHDNQVSRARVLMDRPDLPIERVETYNLFKDLMAELEEAQKSRKFYQDDSAAAWDKCEGYRLELQALKTELKSISKALDDPRTDLTHTMVEVIQALKAQANKPVAWLGHNADGTKFLSWRNTSKNKAPLYTAPQPTPASEPVAWKHDCAALLQNDVELRIDRCPHCGKPRTAPPNTGELVEACRRLVGALSVMIGDPDNDGDILFARTALLPWKGK